MNSIISEEGLSWVSPKLKVTANAVVGQGTFAIANIKKDEILILQSGRILHKHDVNDSRLADYWYHGFQIEKDYYVYPYIIKDQIVTDGIFKINHSCEPNAGFRGQIALVSMRDIAAGEEITYDYAMTDVEEVDEDWEPMLCLCGSKTCRKTVTGSDWKKTELQERYRGYFSLYVAKLIDNTELNS